MKIFTIIVVSVFISANSIGGTNVTQTLSPNSTICQCAIFHINDDPAKVDPIFAGNQSISDLKNGETSKYCRKLCIDTAIQMKNYAPQLICQHLQDINNLKVMLYSRLCCDNKWESTGLLNDEPICCYKGRSVTCLRDSTPQSFDV